MSNIKSIIPVKGIVTIITRESGNIVDQRQYNLVVNVGKALLAKHIGGINTPEPVGTIAVGTSSATPGGSDTLLGVEIYRETCTSSLVTTLTTNDTCRFSMTIDEGDSSADGTLTEAGLFGGDASNSLDPNDGTGNDTGVLLSRVTFDPISKTPAISLTIQWDIIFQ